jgi:type VI protein secretion system component Hcp
MATPKKPGIRIAGPILILSTCFLFGTAASAQTGGYMRALTSHGQVAGGSTDPKYDSWIPLRQAAMPSAEQIAAMAGEASAGTSAAAGKAVHKPVIIVKDRDQSSFALLGACTSHQHFPEIDIAVMNPGDQLTARYKLTDATIISIRASDPTDGMHQPLEQVRINYAKIEIQQ